MRLGFPRIAVVAVVTSVLLVLTAGAAWAPKHLTLPTNLPCTYQAAGAGAPTDGELSVVTINRFVAVGDKILVEGATICKLENGSATDVDVLLTAPVTGVEASCDLVDVALGAATPTAAGGTVTVSLSELGVNWTPAEMKNPKELCNFDKKLDKKPSDLAKRLNKLL